MAKIGLYFLFQKVFKDITTATISKANIEDSNTEGTNMGDINDVVCPADYTNHSWGEVFMLTEIETRKEALRKGNILEDFGAYYPKHPGGIGIGTVLWLGIKDFNFRDLSCMSSLRAVVILFFVTFSFVVAAQLSSSSGAQPS